MLKLSLKILRSSVRINAFVMVQLGAVFFTCIFMAASVYSRLKYYLPFEDIMDSKASAVKFSSEYVDMKIGKRFLLDYRTSPVREELKNTDQIYTRYCLVSGGDMTVYSYDDNVIGLFTPDLASGSWLDGYEEITEDGTVPAVIYQNGYSYDTGDQFSCEFRTYSNESIRLKMKVRGVLKDDSRIFGNTNEPLNNHLSFYETLSEKYDLEIGQNEKLLMVMIPNKIADSCDIVSFYDPVNSIITYDESISDKEAAVNTSELGLRYGSMAENLSSVKEKSLIYIKTQLYTLLPVILCIAFTALISSICTNAVITKKNLKKYVVFYICGFRWERCIGVCLLNGVLTSVISLAAALVIWLLSGGSLSVYGISACFIIMAVYIVLSLIIPYRILRSSTPRGLLIRN